MGSLMTGAPKICCGFISPHILGIYKVWEKSGKYVGSTSFFGADFYTKWPEPSIPVSELGHVSPKP